MATAKKPTRKAPTKGPKLGPKVLMPNRSTDKPGTKVNMPNKSTDKPGVKVNMSKTTKKPKVEGPSNYRQNAIYKLPMTPKQAIAFGELKMSPKTADTVFTLPKGAEKLSVTEQKQMQARRLADRKRTLARGEAIIRRTVGVPKIGGNSYTTKETKKATPKTKKSNSKKVFGLNQ